MLRSVRLVGLGVGSALVALAGLAREAGAQAPDAPLAQLRDDKQLAEALSQITQDPAIPVDDPAQRALAQALMIEGVKQLQARAYDQALANFLEAYGKFPSPRILLNIASTLRDMGRYADAANTYQRYLLDPGAGTERTAEVTDLLVRLDEQLTVLTVHVAPKGSDLSIDGGPFVPVGHTLVTRVRPGLHLVRIRKGDQSSELTVNGFEGEAKQVEAVLAVAAAPNATPGPAPTSGPPVPQPAPAEQVQGWLTTGTQYGTSDASSNQRSVRAGFTGPTIRPIVPAFDVLEGPEAGPRADKPGIHSGVIGIVRIDGKLRGFAGGIGLAIARGRLEGDAMFLRSEVNGGYLGARYRLMNGLVRPYVAAGVPGFLYEHTEPGAISATTKLAIGVRAAGGVELRINGHFSIQGDLGYEHFFGVEDTLYEADVFVPTIGVIGRL